MKNFKEAIEAVKQQKEKKVTAVVAADEHAIQAALEGVKEDMITPIFIGDEAEIKEILKNEGATQEFEIIPTESLQEAAEVGVKLVRDDRAQLILKGLIDTSILLKAVVNKEKGIGTGKIMSHLAILEIPTYHKLLTITDGGMIPYPDIEKKRYILENAVDALVDMGWEKPKVAVMAAIEKVNPGMQETVDAAQLKEWNEQGEIKNCIVEGPISFDLAYLEEAAKLKHYESPVAGDPDILIVPNLACGNMLSKALNIAAKGRLAGLVVGAKAPILLNSRSSTAEEKFLSLVMAQLLN